MQKLTEQEERELFAQYKETGDIAIRNRLLEQYLYIAQIVAKKFTGRGVDYEDLLQVASVELVTAIDRFDPSRNIKFSSFATPSLIGEIKNYFRDKTRMLHISRCDSEQLLKLQDAKAALAEKNKLLPSDIAAYMGVDESRVLELLEIQQVMAVGSLDNYTGKDEDTPIGELIGAQDEGYREVENRDFLNRAMQTLTERERLIVHERYWNMRSQKEIADMLGVSQMNISRIEKKILEKMRAFS